MSYWDLVVDPGTVMVAYACLLAVALLVAVGVYEYYDNLGGIAHD